MKHGLPLLVTVFALSIGILLGSTYSYQTVAKECHKIGIFYLGNKVFECKLKEQP